MTNKVDIGSEGKGFAPASSFIVFEKFSRVAGGKEAGCGGVLADNEAPSGLKSAATETGNREDSMKNASINTFAWSKEASEYVARNLVREVVGSVIDASKDRADGVPAAKLPHEQAPTGERAPVAVTEGAQPEAPVAPIAPVATSELPVPAAPAIPVEAPAADPVAPIAPAITDSFGAQSPIPAEGQAVEAAPEAPVAPGTQSFEGIQMAPNDMGYNTKLSSEDAELLALIFG